MTCLRLDEIHALSEQARLSSERPTDHVALYLTLQDLGVPCLLHGYRLTLENQQAKQSIRGFALEIDQQIWGIGDRRGWEAIEREESDLFVAIFQEFSGHAPDKMIFEKHLANPDEFNNRQDVLRKKQQLLECVLRPPRKISF